MQNRPLFLAFLFGVIARGSRGFAIYVRIQPPTVIRVDRRIEVSLGDIEALQLGQLCPAPRNHVDVNGERSERH
jgi:hypothetical protein